MELIEVAIPILEILIVMDLFIHIMFVFYIHINKIVAITTTQIL